MNLLDFILAILASIMAAYLYDLLKGQNSEAPPIVMIIEQRFPLEMQTNQIANIDDRAINRQRAGRIIALLFYFLITYFALRGLLQLSVSFFGQKIFESGTTFLDLNSVKGLSRFTDARVQISSVNSFITIFSVIIYVPIVILGDKLLRVLRVFYDRFWPVTFEVWIMMRGIIFLFLSFVLSSFAVYLVSDYSLLQSMWMLFLLITFIAAFAFSNQKQSEVVVVSNC